MRLEEAVSRPRGRPRAAKTSKTCGRGAWGSTSACTPALVEAFCAEIAKGRLASAIHREQGMPGKSAWHQWRQKHKWVELAYQGAKDARRDALAARVLEIADSATDIEKARIQIKARMWLVEKLEAYDQRGRRG